MSTQKVIGCSVVLVLLWEITKWILQVMLDDALKNIVVRVFSCKKRREKTDKAEIWSTSGPVRTTTRAHWYQDCEVFSKNNITPESRVVCHHCVQRRRDEARAQLDWELGL